MTVGFAQHSHIVETIQDPTKAPAASLHAASGPGEWGTSHPVTEQGPCRSRLGSVISIFSPHWMLCNVPWNLWERTAPRSAINFVFGCKFLLIWGQRGRRKGIYTSCAPYFPSKLRIWIIDFSGFYYCYAYLKPSRENFIFLSLQISTSQFGSKVLDSNSLVN